MMEALQKKMRPSMLFGLSFDILIPGIWRIQMTLQCRDQFISMSQLGVLLIPLDRMLAIQSQLNGT